MRDLFFIEEIEHVGHIASAAGHLATSLVLSPLPGATPGM